MVTCTIVLRQVLGDWHLTATLYEGQGGLPERSTARATYIFPLTAYEWDSDHLSAVLSATRRWSDMTTQGHPSLSVTPA